MTKGKRFQAAVRAVWKQSYRCYASWPPCRRAICTPAMNDLLAWLGDCQNEIDLDARYWQPGDVAGDLLQRALPRTIESDDRLTLEEACFWLRLSALREGC